MSGSTFGKIFRITTWGESHGSGIGVVIDGCPSGISLNEEDIQIFLDRRKPGQSKFTTRRSEEDTVEILSGIFEGKTTGTPISLLVRNKDQRSRDYGNIVSMFRPGHADYPFTEKYGIRDYRGGGRSSGRETIGRVAAGAIASKILNELGISLCAYTKAIGPYVINETEYNYSEISQNSLYMPNNNIAEQAGQYITSLMKETNSCGGVIECIADGLPVGLGEPVFDKLDALLAQAVMSIGAVKGVEIGDGNYDFECLEAIDIPKFNEDMRALLKGEEVYLPIFDFKSGKRKYESKPKKLGSQDILVIEGIHCLNPKLTETMADANKFKIYISALTQLNIDEHNRIPTTDGRLIRRIVRDSRTRGASASKTISMWASVRRGEEKNIFPFQEEADVMFNSSLIYELAVLKQYVEPLLFAVDKDSKEFIEAKRLLKFFDYFVGIGSEFIPTNSLLREFVGGGCFRL